HAHLASVPGKAGLGLGGRARRGPSRPPHAGSPGLLQPWARPHRATTPVRRTRPPPRPGARRWGHVRRKQRALRAGVTGTPHGRRVAVGHGWPRSTVPQAWPGRRPAVVLPWSWRKAYRAAGSPPALAAPHPASGGAP